MPNLEVKLRNGSIVYHKVDFAQIKGEGDRTTLWLSNKGYVTVANYVLRDITSLQPFDSGSVNRRGLLPSN